MLRIVISFITLVFTCNATSFTVAKTNISVKKTSHITSKETQFQSKDYIVHSLHVYNQSKQFPLYYEVITPNNQLLTHGIVEPNQKILPKLNTSKTKETINLRQNGDYTLKLSCIPSGRVMISSDSPRHHTLQACRGYATVESVPGKRPH